MEENEKTLEDKLLEIRTQWTQTIQNLNANLKDLGGLQNLLNVIYTKRQECSEYIAMLRVTYGKAQRKYKSEWAQRYVNYKTNSQLRFTSDSAINTQIEVELENISESIDMLKIHIEAMTETLETIKSLGYAIKERIRIYELAEGLIGLK